MHEYASDFTDLDEDESEHVAPFLHGDDLHSSASPAQLKPMKPAPHTQPYVNTPSTHVAPFVHGYDEHSSRST